MSQVVASYVQYTDKSVALTKEVVPDTVWIDLDESGRIVGLEIISAHPPRMKYEVVSPGFRPGRPGG